MFRIAIVALLTLMISPALVAAAPSPTSSDGAPVTDVRTDCLAAPAPVGGAVPALVCVAGGVSIEIVCAQTGSDAVDCTGLASWNASAWSPASLPGYAEYQGGSTISWCPPTEPYCRSIGVGYNLMQCTWTVPGGACASGPQNWTFELGRIVVPTGDCVTLTLDGFVYAQASPLVGRNVVGTAKVLYDLETERTVCL